METSTAQSAVEVPTDASDTLWFLQLANNGLVYLIILGPIWLLVRYSRRKGWLSHPPSEDTFVQRTLRLLVEGMPIQELPTTAVSESSIVIKQSSQASFYREAKLLLFCFVGLEGTYLAWGVMQEKIMTRSYASTKGASDVRFKDAQFLVLANRLSAFLVSGIYIMVHRSRMPRHTTPGYKYAFASLSNILSSWCQYEALKFVSFPTQVIGKSAKIIPVMLLGIVIQGKRYPLNQYLTAAMISVGVGLFLFARGQVSNKPVQDYTSFSGLFLIIGYLACDSFTGNWQAKLFDQYKIDSFQMMCGVNLFSASFTLISEMQQGGLSSALSFLISAPMFKYDLAVISVCSAVGQCFIFGTIKNFGAVTFAIMMTIRQALAIMLSCLIFGHVIKPIGLAGVAVLFMGLFLKIYINYRERQLRKNAAPK